MKKTVPFAFKILFALIILTVRIISAQTDSFSINKSPLPPPTGYVNDYVGVFDAATKQRLEQKISDFKNSTNPQVELAVAVVDTTGGRDIFDYSLAVARGWKIGSTEDDNPAALLLIAINDRKYFTQVGKDLEDELPDGLAGQLQRQYLVPEFKRKNYAKGISDTIDAYIDAIKKRQSGVPADQIIQKQKDKEKDSGFGGFGVCLIIGIILLIIIFSRGGKSGSNRGGGGGFGGGGALPWIIGSMIANSGSSSSDSSWGGSSSGDSGWGGFGGGGDFGGGGAGGSW